MDNSIKYFAIQEESNESNGINLVQVNFGNNNKNNNLNDFKSDQGIITGITFSPNEEIFATMSTDRIVRVFQFDSGKMVKKFDERLNIYSEAQQSQKLQIKLDNLNYSCSQSDRISSLSTATGIARLL